MKLLFGKYIKKKAINNNIIYYIDMSVLPKNSPYETTSGIRVRYSEDIADVIPLFFLCFSSRFFYFRKKKHSYLCNKKKYKYFFHSKINFICSRHRVIYSTYIYLTKNIFLTHYYYLVYIEKQAY